MRRHSHYPQHSAAVPESMDHRPRRSGLGYWTQWAVLVLLLCAYAVLAVSARQGTISLLVAGAVVFPVLAIASVKPPINVKDHVAIIGISVGSFVAFILPLAISPPMSMLAGADAVLGAWIAEGIWATNRYPIVPGAHEPLPIRVKASVRFATRIARITSVIAGVVFIGGAIFAPSQWAFLLRASVLTLAGYFGGALVVGILIGIAGPLLASPLGVMAAGMLGGAIAYGALMPATATMDRLSGDSGLGVGVAIGIAMVCGALVGSPVALIWKWSRTRPRFRWWSA